MVMRDIGDLPSRGRLLVDSAPIIYYLEDHPEFSARYENIFVGAEAGDYELAITTVTLVEVLTGPLRQGNEKLAETYRQALTSPPSWRVIDLTPTIAHRAARIRGVTRLRTPDAIQLASALEISCMGLVTQDRDFRGLSETSGKLNIYS